MILSQTHTKKKTNLYPKISYQTIYKCINFTNISVCISICWPIIFHHHQHRFINIREQRGSSLSRCRCRFCRFSRCSFSFSRSHNISMCNMCLVSLFVPIHSCLWFSPPACRTYLLIVDAWWRKHRPKIRPAYIIILMSAPRNWVNVRQRSYSPPPVSLRHIHQII